MKYLHIPKILLFLTIAFCFSTESKGQDREVEPSLRSPYHAVYTHLYFLQEDTYEPELAATVIPDDLGLDSIQRIKKAIQIKRIFDGMGLFVQLSQIPQNPNYLDSFSLNSYYTIFPKKLPQVYLEKIGDNWVYSKETIRLTADIHNQVFPFGAEFFENFFPEEANVDFLGLKLWQFLWIILLLIGTVVVLFVVEWLIRPMLRRFLTKTHFLVEKHPNLLKYITRVSSLIVLIYLLKWILPSLQLPVKLADAVHKGFSIFISVLFAVLLFRFAQVLTAYLKQFAETTEHKMDDQAIPIIDRIIKTIIIAGAILNVLSLLDVNITALIAGISIGGLALALAAKDTVSNLIGSVMIFVDRPFQIGDFIEGNGFAGSVHEVGFRSTRIKAKDTSIISVPNGNLGNMTVKNYGLRVYRLMETTISVTYDTPSDLMELFLKSLKDMALKHPGVENENFYIRFSAMADSSLNILFRVYLNTNDFGEELKFKEEIFFNIVRIAEALGINFAFPSTSIYVEQMPQGESSSGEMPSSQGSPEENLERFFNEKFRGSSPQPKIIEEEEKKE